MSKVIQVILALAILIVIHEAGHFTFAKLFGIRVDKFFLFFDIGGTKLLSTKEGWFSKLFPKLKDSETEYGIGWLPLGGYCKICGMIDESMDLESLKNEPQPWEFRTKKAWQRLLVMAGGVLYNFIFAIIAYICILAAWGDAYLKNDGNYIYVNVVSYDMGFRNGDRILRFDNYVPEDFSKLQADLARRNVKKAVVLRGTDTLDIYIDRSRIGDVLNTPMIFDLAVPFVVDTVMEGSLNVEAGLLRGDRITMIDSISVPFVQDSRPVLAEKAGTTVCATILRDGEQMSLPLQVDTAGRIGVYMISPQVTSREYSFFSAIPAGFKLTWETVSGYVKDLKLVATPETQAYKSVGSFISIGQVFPSAWDWYRFINILALLSIMLGVMNLLPIPGLDGGHILFTLYEIVSGRKPSDKFLGIAQLVGMFLLIALMVLAFGNDIGRLIH
ncbi:MAG: RIP metalloprotease RseP [Bacteroidales bacterium]|nr:RIP metalloprotease RseP [Bacteroidales bacterium]